MKVCIAAKMKPHDSKSADQALLNVVTRRYQMPFPHCERQAACTTSK
jgi:hypothetical protein